MFHSPKLTALRLTTAEAAFVALRTLLPKIHLIEAKATYFGFELDIAAQETPSKEVLSMVEERIREEPVSSMEMVPVSAAGLLRHANMPYRAQAVEESGRQLVTICKIGDHADWIDAPFSEEIGVCSLTRVIKVGDGIIRLEGTAYPSKDALKRAQKERKRLMPHSWESLATPFFFEEANKLWWHPEGTQLVSQVREWWESRQEAIIETPGDDVLNSHKKYFKKTGRGKISEWRGEGRRHIFHPTEADIISSLQFLQEIITIFQITCHVETSGSRLQGYYSAERGSKRGERIDFFYQDVYGRRSQGPFLEWREDVLIQSSFGSVGELIKNLLEGTKGNIPKWLADAGRH